MNSILDKFFLSSERKEVEDRIHADNKLDKKYDTIKENPAYKLAQLEEKINTKTESNFEKRFKAFKKAVLAAEKLNITEAAQKSIEDKTKELVDKAEKTTSSTVDKVIDKVADKADKAIDNALEKTGVTAFSAKLNGAFDKIVELLFNKLTAIFAGTALGAWLGLKDKKTEKKESNDGNTDNIKPQEKEESADGNTENIKPQKKEESADGNTENIKPQKKDIHEEGGESVEESPEGKENLETKIGRYEQMGFLIISSFSREPLTAKQNSSYSYELIKEKKLTYNNLANFNPTKEDLKKFHITQEEFSLFKNTIVSPESKVILNELFHEKNLEKLEKNSKVKEILVSIGISNFKNFNWKTLEINQLMVLTSLSISSIIVNGTLLLGDKSKFIFNKVLSLGNEIDIKSIENDFKQSLTDFEKNIISKELVAKILTTVKLGNANSFNIQKKELEELLGENEFNEKLLEFRNFVKESIIGKERFHLGEQSKIKENISFKDVLELYIAFEGDSTISNNLQSSLIYPWIIKILDKGGDKGSYLIQLQENVFKGKKSINQNDKNLLKVLLKGIIDKTFLNNLKKQTGELKDAAGTTIENNPEIIAWVAGAALVLRFTPAGRIISVLNLLIGKKGIALLASSGVFLYLYNALDIDTQNILQSSKKELKKEFGIDLDKILAQ